MRAIIIEEERFTEIVDLIKAKSEQLAADSSTPERLGWDRNMWGEAVKEAQRTFQYHFVKWAQSHGASCTR